MTNTQQIIKLDLSSLLTETSALSDNKYTSSARELLLNEGTDQSGAGLGSMLAGFGKKAVALGKRAASPERIKQAVGSMTDRGRQLATSVGTAVRNSPERLRKAVGNISPRLSQMKDSVRNAVSPPRTRSTSPNSPRPQNSTQGQQPANTRRNTSAQSRPPQNNDQEQEQQLNDQSNDIPVGEGNATNMEQHLAQIEQDIEAIKQDITRIFQLLESNQQ